MIKPCTCQHEYQDAKYGKGNRVCNAYRGKDGKTYYRCTVCRAEKS